MSHEDQGIGFDPGAGAHELQGRRTKAAELLAKMDAECPPMPDDFWPDEMMVVGKHGNSELAFVIKPEWEVSAELRGSLRGLRLALWAETNWKNLKS